jgi:hypothetical protein
MSIYAAILIIFGLIAALSGLVAAHGRTKGIVK